MVSRAAAARVAAPVAFLVAVTIVVLLVRSGLREGSATSGGAVVAVTTGEQSYVVRRGDTLESIARRHGTTVGELQRLNPGIDPVELRVGRRLRVK